MKKIYLIPEQQKATLNKKSLAYSGLGIFMIGLSVSLVSELTKDTSVVILENGSISREEIDTNKEGVKTSKNVGSLLSNSKRLEYKTGEGRRGKSNYAPLQVNYNAKQVIERKDEQSSAGRSWRRSRVLGKQSGTQGISLFGLSPNKRKFGSLQSYFTLVPRPCLAFSSRF